MARTFIGRLVVQLVDQVSARAKTATASLRELKAAGDALGAGTRLNVLSGSLMTLAREAQALRPALAGLQVPPQAAAEIARLARSGRGLSRLTADVNALSGSLRGLGSGIPGSLGLDRLRADIARLRAEMNRLRSDGRAPPPGFAVPPHSPFRPAVPHVPGSQVASQALGYPGAGPVINRTGHMGFTAGLDLQRQNTLDLQAGLDRGESGEIRRLAIGQSRRRLAIGPATFHEIFREAMIGMGGRAGGGMAKLREVAPDIADSVTQMQTRYGPERATEQFRALFRALDVVDRNDRPEVIRELLQGFTRAQGVEGAEFNYRDLYNAARYSKSAGQALSNRFLFSELPVIMGDVGGSRAGTELGSLYAQLIGNRSSEKAKEEQRRLGVRDDAGVIGREMMSDPGEWARKILMPGLQRSGIDINNPAQVVEAVNKVVSNQVVAAMLARAITQRDRIRERQQQYDLAPSGPEGADAVERMDGRMALQSVVEQFKGLLGAGFDPILEEFRGPLRNLATTLNEWAEQVRQSPEKVKEAFSNFAGTVGALAIALGGLKVADLIASAAAGPALLRSASALTVAARALQAAALQRNPVPIPTGPMGPAGSTAANAAAGAAAGSAVRSGMMRFVPGLGWVMGGAAIALGGYAAGQAIGEVSAIAQGKYWTPKDQEEIEGYKARIAELQERLAGINQRTHPSMRDAPNPERSNIEGQIADLQNRIRAGEERRAASDQGHETGGSFGQERPEDRGHETGQAFSAHMAQGVASGAGNVLQQMETLMQQLREKAADGVTINIRTTTIPGTAPLAASPPGRARGGPVTAGQLYTVGEVGPELFRPAVDGSIIPNHQMASALSAADGGMASPTAGQPSPPTGGAPAAHPQAPAPTSSPANVSAPTINLGGIHVHAGQRINPEAIFEMITKRMREELFESLSASFSDSEYANG